MGLFDSLFGGKKRTKVEVIPERIWLTTDAKYAGLATEYIERAQTDSVAILLVAHFADVRARLDELAMRHPSSVPVRVVLAADLNAELASSLQLDEDATIDVIVGERHPLRSVDDRLEAFAEGLPCRCRLSHHISLDDAVIKIFTGDRIRDLLEKLGMSDDEAIESAMVSRRIRQAQAKIEGRAFGSLAANSALEWIENNCPDVAGN